MYRSGLWDDIQDTKLGFICEWDTWEDNTEVSVSKDAVLFNNHYYKFFTLEYDWEMAAYYCEKMGGHLVTISSAEENNFVNELSQGQNIWLGGSDVSTTPIRIRKIFIRIPNKLSFYTNIIAAKPNAFT